MVTERQALDVSAVAALAWAWMSLAGEGRPAAMSSVLATFQGQYNARLGSLRAAYAAAGMDPPFPLTTLAVNGTYSGAVGRAMANVSVAASGRRAAEWLSGLPASRYDDNMIQMIWDVIQSQYPVSGTSQVGVYLWTMVRSFIGVADAQAGQNAINSILRTGSNVSYQVTPAQFAEQLAAKVPGGNGGGLPAAGEDAQFMVDPEAGVDRSYAFDADVVRGRAQARTNSYVIWLVLAGAVGVGAIAYSRYRSEA